MKNYLKIKKKIKIHPAWHFTLSGYPSNVLLGKLLEFNNMNGNEKYHCENIPNSEDVLALFEILEINSVEDMNERMNKCNVICMDSEGQVLISDDLKNFFNISSIFWNR